MRYLIFFFLLLAVGCTHSPSSSAVLGVEIEPAEGREVRWDKASDVIAECAAKLADPRVMNGVEVKQYATQEEVGHHCLSAHSAACYLDGKDRILLSPRDDHELPAFCHEIGHRISALRGDGGDPCHLDGRLWGPIDGSTCTCPGRCERAIPIPAP